MQIGDDNTSINSNADGSRKPENIIIVIIVRPYPSEERRIKMFPDRNIINNKQKISANAASRKSLKDRESGQRTRRRRFDFHGETRTSRRETNRGHSRCRYGIYIYIYLGTQYGDTICPRAFYGHSEQPIGYVVVVCIILCRLRFTPHPTAPNAAAPNAAKTRYVRVT